MRHMKRFLSMFLITALTVGLLAGCGSETSEEATQEATLEETEISDQEEAQAEEDGPSYGGHLNVHIMSEPNGLDPIYCAATWRYFYMGCVYEGPLTRDENYEIAPGVCNYELSEDQLTLKLWVRDGMTFHDGSSVEIEDVKASIERCCTYYSAAAKYLAPYIESMEIEGDELVMQFTSYSDKAWVYLAAWQTWMGVMPKEICEKYGEEMINVVEDAIGTGPYKVVEFEVDYMVTVERYDGYVPCEEGYTGYAAPKLAYLDSLSFWYNDDYSSSTMAVLAGDYDITDVIETDYQEMAAEAGIIRENMGPSLNGWMMGFNNTGGENLCAQYPDLRKAIMAAMDVEELTRVISDEAAEAGGSPVVGSKYATELFESADWFGPSDQELVDSYLEAARAQGYQDEPIQLVAASNPDNRTAFTLICGYLANAGINYEMNYMEPSAALEFVQNTDNNWDARVVLIALSFTPTTISDFYINNYWVDETKDALVAELHTLKVGSEEYIAKWQELAAYMVDSCTAVHLGDLNWYWNHLPELHLNDAGRFRYFFNAYWDNPEEHTR